jgi:hypothetical protein
MPVRAITDLSHRRATGVTSAAYSVTYVSSASVIWITDIREDFTFESSREDNQPRSTIEMTPAAEAARCGRVLRRVMTPLAT